MTEYEKRNLTNIRREVVLTLAIMFLIVSHLGAVVLGWHIAKSNCFNRGEQKIVEVVRI
jgi:hypothetical protein